MKKAFVLLLFQIFTTATITFASGLKDTTATVAADSSRHQTIASYVIPAGLIGYGVLSFHNPALRSIDFRIQRNFSNGHNRLVPHVDDVLQYAPAATVYVLNALNIPGKHNFADRTFTYLIAEGLMLSTTQLMKNGMSRLNSSGKITHGFPSGHIATAFLAAEFLSQEYGDSSAWYTIGGYTIATTATVLRVRNNYHYLSDVVAGAGIGIASAKIAYLLYPMLKRAVLSKKSNHIVIMPTRFSNINGVYIAGTF